MTVTDQKQAEKLSQKHLTMLKKASRIANLGGWEWDIDTNTFHLSEEWQEIHGYDGEYVSGDRLLMVAHPDDVAAVQAAFDKALKRKTSYDLTHRIIRQTDGEIRFIKADTGEIITDDRGNLGPNVRSGPGYHGAENRRRCFAAGQTGAEAGLRHGSGHDLAKRSGWQVLAGESSVLRYGGAS